MKEERLSQDYLRDILDAIAQADEFVKGVEFENFRQDNKTVFAVVRALEVIGEAAKKIPDNIKKRFSDIPWRHLTGMRDKLIHDYSGISLGIVWKTVKDDLPALKPMIIRVLEEIEKEE